MAQKKYVSLTRLSNFLDNIKAKYSQIGHKHKVSDLTDYKVDTELSSTSSNPVANKTIDAEFEAVSTAMGALDLAIDGKANAEHSHNDLYYTETEIDAKLASKSDSTHTHSNYVPTSRTVNGKALTANISLSASDVGALPNTTSIPDSLSDLASDSSHRTVTDAEKSSWNAKSNFSGNYNDLTNKPTIPSISGLATETYVNDVANTKVDKVSGKGLSTNDYTTTEKNKLSGIASGAEVNQNAFSNVVVGSTTIAADSKTDSLTIASGTGISIDGDATNDKVTITNSGVRSIATGSANGTISVNTNGSSANVAVKGLGSAAYTASTAYDAAGTAQTKADTALNSAKSYTDEVLGEMEEGFTNVIFSMYGDDFNESTEVPPTIREIANSEATAVKNALLNGAGTAFDTLKELGDLIVDNQEAIDALETIASGKANATHSHSISDVTNLQTTLDGKAAKSHGTHVSYSTTAPVMDGTASVGSASTVARSDHKHPTDTSRASKTEFDTHTADTTAHMTSTQKTQLSTAYTHSQAAHAPSNAEKNQNAFSNVKVGSTTIAADTTTDTLTLVAGTNVTITPDATNDKITISATDTNTTYSAGTGISLSGTTFSNSGVRSVATGTSNGTISVNTNGTSAEVAVKGLGSAAYTASTAYDAAGAANTALTNAKSYTDEVASGKANTSHSHAIADVSGLQSALDGKAASSHGTHVSYSTTAPVMDGTAAVGTATTVARSDHKHPTDTSRASKTDFDNHVANTTAHITSTERTNWGTAYTHSQAAHAPSNAEKNQNAFSNIKVGTTTVSADTATDTVELVGSNVTITPDATNDKITIGVASGSTSAAGILKLTNSTSSTSTTTAATPSSVKSAYDLANTAKTNAATAQTRADNAYALAEGKVDSLSDLGVTATAAELNYVDGVTSNIQTQLDGKASSGHNHIYYGVCSTAAATAAKTVTVDNFSLVTGAMVIVKFSEVNSASSPTLNVSGTGAKPIYRYGTTAASTSASTSGWRAGAVQIFVYDGTGWVRDFWENSTYSNVSLGQGYATCSTAAATVAKTASLSSYSLSTGGIVSVRFTYSVPASATLNINSKGAKAIYYNNAAIVANVIKGGDTATFIYDGSRYRLISIDRWHKDIVDLQTNDKKTEQKLVSANANYPLLLAQHSQTSDTTGFTYFDSGVYLNPSTNKIYADIDGTATGLSKTLDIAKGGTGATTAAAARTNLGITLANLGAASSSHNHSGQSIAPASIELGNGASGHGGFIDFHYNNSANDYTSRICEYSSGSLTFQSKIQLTADAYGTSLPTAGLAGRIFFKKV